VASANHPISGKLDSRKTQLRAQVKQALRLLVLCAPQAPGKDLSLTRNPLDVPLAISDCKQKWTARLRIDHRRAG
jgi:hypothetical protein